MSETLCEAELTTLAGLINTAHAVVMESIHGSVKKARDAGELLLRAKARCPHGQWLPWLAANTHLGERTARNYMLVARRWLHLLSNRHFDADLAYGECLAILGGAEPGDEEEGDGEPLTPEEERRLALELSKKPVKKPVNVPRRLTGAEKVFGLLETWLPGVAEAVEGYERRRQDALAFLDDVERYAAGVRAG